MGESVPPLPYHCLSDDSKATIDKCDNIFGGQLSENRGFLERFEEKVEHVYVMESVRNELKGMKERKILEAL
jgi:hypothetical protein